jgi:pimeloyl-ACP methyl ester carboxylesterase
MGCSSAIAFGVAHPEVTLSLLLWWPVGGAKYRINGHLRFAEHLAYVKQNGLAQVAALARSGTKSFGEDPRGGPWVSVLRRDAAFADAYVRHDVDRYLQLVAGMARGLLDRDTSPGVEPEDLLRLEIPALVVPGRDNTHATSAARYLEECLPKSQYWDVPVSEQTEANAPARLLEFLSRF